jgi:Disulfide bond formation protein DsbB
VTHRPLTFAAAVDPDTIGLFFALLAVLAAAGTAAVLACSVAARLSPRAGRWWAGTRPEVARSALPLAFAVALTATLGSLYFSEVANFPPCRLCWFQRIAMYPLSLLLGIALVRRDAGVRPYGIALALAGLPVSAWHVLVERFPSLESGSCDPTAPCTVRWVDVWGFATLPLMALVGFATVATLLAVRPEEP